MSKFKLTPDTFYCPTDHETIQDAVAEAKRQIRHYSSDTGGSGWLASQAPRMERELDAIEKAGGGKTQTQPGGATWTIKKAS